MANHSNTSKTGTDFENKAFKIISELMNEGKFYGGGQGKIFLRKKYPVLASKLNKYITVDISIELYLPDATEPWQIVIFECKDYAKGKGAVPTSDCDEFRTKLQKLGNFKCKGVFITENSFTDTMIEDAQQNGIALIQISPDESLNYIVHRIAKDYNQKTKYKINTKNPSKKYDIYHDGFQYTFLPQLFIDLQILESFELQPKHLFVPFITKNDIVRKANQLRNNEIYEFEKISTDKLLQFLDKTLEIPVEIPNNWDFEDNVLGYITFDPITICISPHIPFDTPRWRFTLAHEIGHLILHTKLLSTFFKLKYEVLENISLNFQENKNMQSLEIQANIFASHLLVSDTDLKNHFNKFAKIDEPLHKPYLDVDSQYINQNILRRLLYKTSHKFGISKTVAKIRFMELNLIRENYNLSPS